MSRYGIDYYGLGYYGSDNPIKFDATPFTATPSKQGQITLNWTDPSGSWSKLVLVRNSYGFPVDAWDGVQLLTAYNGSDPVIYVDEQGLNQGSFYYYSIFVFNTVQYSWVNAGNAFALCVKDCGNTEKLYNYLPEIYKITQPYTATSDWDNPALYDFLSNFGFELDYEQTLTDLLTNKYDIQKVSGVLIPTMMNQFGLTYEAGIGLQQNRVILRDGVTLNKQKGSKDGLAGYIKDFTNWAVSSINVSDNIMLDYNDSSFEEGTGHWTTIDGTGQIDHLNIFKIKSVSLTSNVARLYLGPHNYDVGNEVIVDGLPLPLFNDAVTPVTLTGVDQTSYVEFSLTSSDVPETSGYNPATNLYGTMTPYPYPWVEPTAPILFPNKSKGVMAVYNASTSAQTVNVYCGDDAPITKGIPVTFGLDYTFSIYASKGAFTARDVTAEIKWYDRFGTYISTSSGSAISDNTTTFSSSYRPYVTDTAPADAYYACPGISIDSVGGSASNEHHYFDAAQFEQSLATTDFDEARQLHITLRANRINELINPHFESPTTPWSVTGATDAIATTYAEPGAEVFSVTSGSITSNVATITLDYAHSYPVGSTVYISGVTGASASDYNGTRTITAVTLTSFSYAVTASDSSISDGIVYKTGNSLELTASGTSVAVESWDGVTSSQLMEIYYPSTSYTFSVYAKSVTDTEYLTASIVWYDDTYTLIDTSAGDSTEVTTSEWARPYVTATAPSNAVYASVKVECTTTVGNVVLLDSALFENSGQLLEYFDGSGGQGTVYDFFWEGNVPNAARSHYYKNRFSIQTRLIESVLQGQLPLGTTAALYLAQPNT